MLRSYQFFQPILLLVLVLWSLPDLACEPLFCKGIENRIVTGADPNSIFCSALDQDVDDD